MAKPTAESINDAVHKAAEEIVELVQKRADEAGLAECPKAKMLFRMRVVNALIVWHYVPVVSDVLKNDMKVKADLEKEVSK